MPYLRKRFRWGASVLAIEHHFSTREVKALHRYCKKLIRDYCNAALEGEGYGASIITFEMFEYGFVFAYGQADEEWILEVVTFPDFASPQCRRKLPRTKSEHRRVGGNQATRRRPDAARLFGTLAVLYRKFALAIMRAGVRARARARIDLRGAMEIVRGIRIPQSPPERASFFIELFKNLAEQQSHERVDVFELVRGRVNTAVSFLGPLWTLRFRNLQRASLDGLWDVSLFGALPEQANG